MATINGTNNAETLYGTSSADSIFGFNGNDTLKGGGGADRLDGGNGIDTVFYGDSNVGVSVNLATGRGALGTAEGDTYVSIENVYGSSFNDTITGSDGDNQLYGLDGNDVLKGGGGSDSLDGGGGDDILKGGGGADALVGGSGIDTADYSQAAATGGVWGVIVNLSNNTAYYGDAQGDTFSGIENLTGSAYYDFLYGNDVANVLRGLDGHDQLFGYGGNDVLDGGNGNDVLDGGAGVDTMTGGAGDDTYYVDNASDTVSDAAGQGAQDSVYASTSYTITAATEIEFMFTTDQNGKASINLTGNDFNQYIGGNEGANVFNGLGGADRLSGRGGNDQLSGGDGDDLLFGGAGADQMTGGNGADQFVYYVVSETGVASGTMDIVQDFSAAQGDKFNFSQMDADSVAAGHQAWTFIGRNPYTGPGQITIQDDGVNTFIVMNNNGDLISDAAIQVAGLHNVDASWFVL
jgi:Ca2+-binding RTX toxin-like protein